jgi:hypothetical protein
VDLIDECLLLFEGRMSGSSCRSMYRLDLAVVSYLLKNAYEIKKTFMIKTGKGTVHALAHRESDAQNINH